MPVAGILAPGGEQISHGFGPQSLADRRDAITKHMLALPTHLGHSTVANTYWFLEAVPELTRDSAERTERFFTRGN
jgi:integrase/recombinase XerD